MKTLLLILFGFIGIKSTFAQNDLAIQQWQNAHPTVLLMSSEDFAQLESDIQAAIEGNVIIYSGELTLEDLTNAFITEKSGESSMNTIEREADREFVKIWLALNPHVKIIRRSEFLAANEELQSTYQNEHALLLKGETITVEDINNY